MSDLSKLTPNAETVAALVECELQPWIAYADKLERVLELVCGESKDQLMKIHAEQGLRLVRPTSGSVT